MAQTNYAYKGYALSPAPEIEHEQPKKQVRKRKVNARVFARVAGSVFFLMVFTIVLRYTIINEMTTQVLALEKELQTVTAANEQHMVYLDKSGDLKSVEQIAQTELNMGVPQSHQVVNVTLNMKDKTVKPTGKTGSFFTSVKNVISYCLEYLY